MQKKKIFHEFMMIDDLSKFNDNSNIYLSNGIKTSKFYVDNYIYIQNNNSDDCKMIVKQYKMYLFQKKQRETFNLTKCKLEFYKMPEDKFYEDSNLYLTNKENSYSFFARLIDYYQQEPNLSKLDFEILRQYEVYLSFIELKKEFLSDDSMEKFDESGYVRFENGAIKNIWWTVYKDDILNSDHDIDIKISNQYKKIQNKD